MNSQSSQPRPQGPLLDDFRHFENRWGEGPGDEVAERWDAEPPGGDAEPPGKDAAPPGGDAAPPGGDAAPPGGDAEPPGGDARQKIPISV